MCDQQRLSPACAYAQTDQSLCLSLNYYMSVQLLFELNLEFLSLTGDCTGSSESILVKMPHCWKSHVAAHSSRDLRICCTRFPTPGSAAIFVSDLSRRNSFAIITGAPEIYLFVFQPRPECHLKRLSLQL